MNPVKNRISELDYEKNYLFNIDLVNSCNLHCPFCVRGTREMKNTPDKMGLDLFENIIKKITSYGAYNISFYNWSEPFLNDNLESFVSIADRFNLVTRISTNLSLREIKNLKPVLYTGTGDIIVSVSGFTQETHQIYHRGSDISIVKGHLEFISSCYKENPYRRTVIVKYLDFKYNSHEIASFETWTQNLPGIDFTTDVGIGDPMNTKDINYQTDEEIRSDRAVAAKYISWGYGDSAGPAQIKTMCEMAKHIQIDYKGDVFACCYLPFHPFFKIGNILDDTIDDLMLRKLVHPICTKCIMLPKTTKLPIALRQRIITDMLGQGNLNKDEFYYYSYDFNPNTRFMNLLKKVSKKVTKYNKLRTMTKLPLDRYVPNAPISDIESMEYEKGIILCCGKKDPQIYLKLANPLDRPAGIALCEINYTNSEKGVLQIYFDFGNGLSEENSVVKTILPSTEATSILLPIVNWLEGLKLTALRVDPPNGTKFVLNEIKIQKD